MALSLEELLRRAEENGVDRLPVKKTLNIYGLTLYEWLHLLNSQGWVCGCCGGGRGGAPFNIDHHHIRGWKKLSKPERKSYVRGILCWRCNKIVVSSRLTAEESARITTYLRKYEGRRKGEESKERVKGVS